MYFTMFFASRSKLRGCRDRGVIWVAGSLTSRRVPLADLTDVTTGVWIVHPHPKCYTNVTRSAPPAPHVLHKRHTRCVIRTPLLHKCNTQCSTRTTRVTQTSHSVRHPHHTCYTYVTLSASHEPHVLHQMSHAVLHPHHTCYTNVTLGASPACMTPHALHKSHTR
jgi:hypothetical protein